jgi:hypothetical protein
MINYHDREGHDDGMGGPRDVDDVSWAVGMFFSFHFIFIILTKLYRYQPRLI